MNSLNIFIIIVILLCFVTGFAYEMITDALTSTKKTVLNTKIQICPDYWIYDYDNIKCDSNDVNLGTYTSNQELSIIDMDFCAKQKYAYDNKIAWDGVSNVYNPRCSSDVHNSEGSSNKPNTINEDTEKSNDNTINTLKEILCFSVNTLLCIFIYTISNFLSKYVITPSDYPNANRIFTYIVLVLIALIMFLHLPYNFIYNIFGINPAPKCFILKLIGML